MQEADDLFRLFAERLQPYFVVDWPEGVPVPLVKAAPPPLPEPEPTLHYHEDWEGFTGPVSDVVRVDGDLVVTILHDSDNPPEPSPCAHQWLPLKGTRNGNGYTIRKPGAWCPECGETREAP